MGETTNVNDNPALKKNFINDKDNVNKRKLKSERARRIAGDLVRKFGGDAEKCYNFFLKCAWRFSEMFIWDIFEKSKGKDSPIKYFIAVMKSQPEMC